MPRPKKTEAEREAMREQILDTALAILQEEGPEAITSRAIAGRLGVAHMSLYTYFEDQSEILRALGEREQARWRAKQQDIEQQDGNIRELVRQLLQLNITFAREKPGLFRLALLTPEVMGENPAQSRQRIQTSVEQLARMLKLGMEQGVFARRDPFVAAGIAIQIVNMPYILFHSGRLQNPLMRDILAGESLSAAMIYLSHLE